MNKETRLQALLEEHEIKATIDAYAHFADTRQQVRQANLFTEESVLSVYYDPRSATPSQTYLGKKELPKAFAILKEYDATMHFVGQSTIKVSQDLETATAITYCFAHHLKKTADKQAFMVAAIRYHDKLVKLGSKWLFSERKLLVDWVQNS